MKEYESILFLGIRVDDPAYKGLPKVDRDHIHGVATDIAQENLQFRPILRHGGIVAYGVPIITPDPQDDFCEVPVADVIGAIERARNTVARVVRKTSVPFTPKLYSLKLYKGTA